MASYIKGITDYIPVLTPFKPDYKFMSNVLDVRQDRYDSNFKALNDLYSQVVYAPLSRDDNRSKRDQYAKQISNGLKQISGVDLSLQSNVDVAKGIFKPFLEDKALVHDMAATKMYQKANQTANNFLNNPDPKMQERWWQTGVDGLNMWMDNYKKASPEKAMTMSMPNYVENPNLYDKAFETLKDSGLKIKQTTLDGGWIVTTQNGTALTNRVIGYKRDKNGNLEYDKGTKNPIPIYDNPAAEFLYNTVAKDAGVQRAFMLEAQVAAWKFSGENQEQYGSVENAKKAWAENQLQIFNQTSTDKIMKDDN